MIVMSKDEIRSAIRMWPANTKQPVSDDAQSWLTQTAAWRYRVAMKRHKLLFEERKGQ
jgi:hypothetical protein